MPETTGLTGGASAVSYTEDRLGHAQDNDRGGPALDGAGEIYAQHAKDVDRFLGQLGVVKDREDALQDVFVVVLRRLDTFEGRSTLRTWVLGIALRVAAGYRRKRQSVHDIVDADVPDNQTPEETSSQRQIERLVQGP